MDREEHLRWAKDRALEYAQKGDGIAAFASLASDLGKHPETQAHIGLDLGMKLMMIGKLSTVEEMTRFIEGFN